MNTPPDLVALSVAHASYDNLLVRLTRLKKKGGQNDRPEYGHGPGTSTVTVTSSPVTSSVDASLEHPEVCQSQVPSSPKVRIFGYFKESLGSESGFSSPMGPRRTTLSY